MKIAFISSLNAVPWGGSEYLWSEVAKRLAGMGHEVAVSVARFPGVRPEIEALKHCGVTICERKPVVRSLSQRLANRLGRTVSPKRTVDPAWRQIQSFRPDLVCVSHGGTINGIDWMLKSRRDEIPYVSISQANQDYNWPDDSRVDDIVAAYGSAVATYFVSRENLRLFEDQIGRRLSNAEVVWNPFNVSWEANPDWPDESKGMRIASVGRMEPGAKGQDLLFRVMSQEKWRSRPVSLTLYGKGPAEAVVRRLAAHNGIADRVSFAGHVTEVERIWRENHCLVMPSRFEGLPLSLVEAMLCRRPAVVTKVGGSAEPLVDNVTGFIAEAPTVKLLDEAMERAWQRRNEWQAIGIKAGDAIRDILPKDPPQVLAEKLQQIIT